MTLPRIALLLFVTLGSAVGAQNTLPVPPLGKLIDVGGYRVHLYCTGEGSPTVFIVGGFSVDWDLVQPSIAKLTRVCTYDVSGTAWSDAGPAVTCRDRVNEIHKLLENAGIERPFVFVGHSIGALVGREYDFEHPREIAGMVMVDHAFLPPGVETPPTPAVAAPPDSKGDSPPVLLHRTPIDLTMEDTSDFQKLPEHARELHRWAAARKPTLPTAETAEDCVSQLASAAQNPHPLGNRPLVVISTGNDSPGYAGLQRKLLLLSTNSKQLMAERSFHSVEIDEPEVVIRGIREVVEAVRGDTKH
ncbi:MAG TPA: alpha/beta hydrolase [Bryobacteraceae bacterium]|jgi:pimeloyl-ACP methyl ester carboxylesterase